MFGNSRFLIGFNRLLIGFGWFWEMIRKPIFTYPNFGIWDLGEVLQGKTNVNTQIPESGFLGIENENQLKITENH